MPLFFKQFVAAIIWALSLSAFLAITGCQGFSTAALHDLALSADGQKTESKDAAKSKASAKLGDSAAAAGDRAVLARSVEKDSKGRNHCVWIRTIDPSAQFRWYYPKLEEILSRPPDRRPDFHALLSDTDQIVAANAALVLARAGDAAAQDKLAETVQSPDMALPMRCAAVEALANLHDPKTVESLNELLNQYSKHDKNTKAPYIPELHAELIHGLARHVGPADNPQFIDALRSPHADVRLEALKAYAASREKTLPVEAVDLRSDGDYRIRSAALELIASRRHPQAMEYISSALFDSEMRVRHAAIASLGMLGTPEALASLQKMLKDQNESVRLQAVSALAAAKIEKPVLEAAGDQSWRVRRKVAESLALFSDRDAVSAAERLLDDNSAEVQLAAVRAMQAWPLERSGPIMLAAMSKSAFVTRKAAAEQLTAQWPAAKEFPIEGPLERRTEVLKTLNQSFRSQFAAAVTDPSSNADPAQLAIKKATLVQVTEVERFVRDGNLKAMTDYGPVFIDALEQLHFDRKQLLPDEVYRQVLPKYGRVYIVLDQLASTDVIQRRRAAEELAVLSKTQPLGRLALERLAYLIGSEHDALVWQSALRTIAGDPSKLAIEMAYTAIGHTSAEVRRRACEHLIAHPDAAHVQVLIPSLEDSDVAVVCAASRALAVAGNMPDTKPLRNLLGSTNEDIQFEAAMALTRLGDPSGKPAFERLAYSRDPAVRAKTAQAMGEFPDADYTPVLVHLLNDNLTVARAALNSLPKVVGQDIAQAPGQAPTTTTEQMLRWKHWHERQLTP